MPAATQVPSADLAARLADLLGDPARVITQATIVERLSRDFFWYSPVLRAQLEGKHADLVVQPVSTAEVQAVLRLCFQLDVPVTARGAGTGNYGQAVPLHGGVVLDLSRMDAIETITPEGIAVCGPGTKLGTLETKARTSGWELRCYPSTIAKATVGGFLAGGSGGIGSVTHGGLREFGTVHAFDAVTMEAEPRLLHHEGEGVHEILHAWGTNSILTRVWLTLAPAVDWAQVALAFPSWEDAYDFSEAIATKPEWSKRLVTVFEPPIPTFFAPIRQLVREDHTSVFLLIAEAQREAVLEVAAATGAAVTLSEPYKGLRSQPLLSDYTWNHTTLWAMKADPSYTYLQCGLDTEAIRAREQLAALKERFGNDFLHHIEWMKNGAGVVFPVAIPVVRFTDEARLNDMIDTCRSLGVFVANPHVNHVQGGGRFREDNVQLQAKHRYDPKNLLNPGKMLVEAGAADAGDAPNVQPEAQPA